MAVPPPLLGEEWKLPVKAVLPTLCACEEVLLPSPPAASRAWGDTASLSLVLILTRHLENQLPVHEVGLADLSSLFEGFFVSKHPQYWLEAALSQIHLGCLWLVPGRMLQQ